MKLKNKIIFITGATKGIGFALAKLLSEKGNTVVIGGRNEAVLAQLNKDFDDIKTVYFDALDDTNIQNIVNIFQNKYGKLDILINNAAICHSYDFVKNDVSFEEIAQEITTNIASPIKLTKLFLPLLHQPTETAIVNITSAVAYLPMRSIPVYSATKAALQSFTISLRESLLDTKINVFEALPPLVATQMTENLIGNGKNMPKMSAEKCAEAIVKGIEKNDFTIRIGSSKSLFWGSRFFPTFVQKQINKM
ncbi:MAG: hypothetical protein RL757_1313 [Bacteroidota bacterium]|jgi:uncharacterized oxidoreductase